MKWLKSLIEFFKNNNDDMISEEQLISYKQNFTNETFQWIKTNDPTLIGKVVKCRDIQPNGNSVVAIFDDGSSIPVHRITNDLMMIHGDMQPMTKDEVVAINGPSIPTAPKNIPNEEIVTSMKGLEPTGMPPNQNAGSPEKQASAENPFKMFNSDETDFLFKLKIRLPDKKLLKMMYNNAEDKNTFLSQLSEYVYESLTLNIIEDSLKVMLEPKQKVQKPTKKEESIKLIQVDDE